MELLPAAAALAVILITAGFVLRTTPPPRDKPAPAPPLHDKPAPAPPPAPAEPEDPWIVSAEPLIVEDVDAGSERGAPAPVLAYVEEPRRSPDPERLLQTEVLVRIGPVTRFWRGIRLIVSLLVLGAALGFGLIGVVRAAIWLFSSG